MRRLKFHLLIRFLPILLIFTLMFIAWQMEWVHMTLDTLKKHHQQLKTLVHNHPIISASLYISAYILLAALSVPGATLGSLTGGFLFPQPWSTLLVISGATIGASILFLAAKTALGPTLQKKQEAHLEKMRHGFQENAASYLLFLRLVPMFPFWLVNLAAAFFNVPLSLFLWTTFIGITPGAFVYTQAGRGLDKLLASNKEISFTMLFNPEIRLALLGLGILALLPALIKYCQKRKTT